MSKTFVTSILTIDWYFKKGLSVKNFTKKLLDLYHYPKEIDLKFGSSICRYVLVKVLGQSIFNLPLTNLSFKRQT